MQNDLSDSRQKTDHMMCPICGFGYLPDDAVNHGICPSCGTEFGYDDMTCSHEALRVEWLRSGGHWFDSMMAAPPNWNARQQVMAAFYRPILKSSTHNRNENTKVHWDVPIRKDIPFEARVA
jgi:predicted RNA-binding Zn-ribbon protein involved in translation (DUF1610 family)